MVTIKNIAELAGVAQGTVSNVLNGKGNVGSEKIRRVMDAARELGYVPNERAALLRKGESNTLVVMMPDSRSSPYLDFYSGFKNYARQHGFAVTQFLTNENNPGSEQEALNAIRSLMAKGIACIPANPGAHLNVDRSEDPLVRNMLFVERKPGERVNFLGFDYHRAGEEIGKETAAKGYSNICLLTGNLSFSNESDFYYGFMKSMMGNPCTVSHIQTDSFRKSQNIMQIFNGILPQAFVISNYEFAESVKDICQTFYPYGKKLDIYTVSPVFTMPEKDYIKYEMNYRQLGKLAAQRLIRGIRAGEQEGPRQEYLEGTGFRDWYAHIIVPENKEPLNILTLDSPEAYNMRTLSRLYTQKTGVEVNVCIASYDEIYESFNTMGAPNYYDILRIDVTWLPWFANQILLPLDTVDPEIEKSCGEFLDGTMEHYSRIHGRIYALPSTPSMQLLFYRKDLFESPIYKRMYYERYKRELRPPTTFEEFNQIARFFTKAYNSSSPTEYGATVTLGSTGVAGSEYLARLFSHQSHLYDENRQIRLNSEAGIESLKELTELRHYTSLNYCSWWTSTAQKFSTGNYAMSIIYNNYATELLGHHSRVVGNIGYCLTPGDNPVIGGGSLGISKYCRRPGDALSFIKWFCSETISSAATLLGSTSPCKKTYENYEIIQNFPWLNLAQKCFVLTRGRRIPDDSNILFDERKFLSILGTAVKNAYSGITTPEEALNFAQNRLEESFVTKF